jgi:hypothetical protein
MKLSQPFPCLLLVERELVHDSLSRWSLIIWAAAPLAFL